MQILQALGRPSDLRADLAGPVLDGLRWAYPYRLNQARAQAGDTVTIARSPDPGTSSPPRLDGNSVTSQAREQ